MYSELNVTISFVFVFQLWLQHGFAFELHSQAIILKRWLQRARCVDWTVAWSYSTRSDIKYTTWNRVMWFDNF